MDFGMFSAEIIMSGEKYNNCQVEKKMLPEKITPRNQKINLSSIIVLSGNVVGINKMPRKKYKKRTCKKNQRDCGTKF